MGDSKRQWRTAAWFAAGVVAFLLLSDCILTRIHARGWAQPVLAMVNATAAVMEFPGFNAVLRARLRDGHVTPMPIWWLLLAINFVFWMVVARLAMKYLFRARESTDVSQADVSQATRATSRRTFLTNSARVATAGLVGLEMYTTFVEARWFEITHHEYPLRGLPRELNGLRVAQLTDIHHGPNLSLGYVRDVVAATNELKADIVLLTGDYVYQSPMYITPVVRELAELRAKIGVIGTLGNHDWWQDPAATRREFARAAIPLIDNGRLFIDRQRALVRSATEGLCIGGVGDFFEDEVRFDAALAGVPEGMPRIVLSHNPDTAEDRTLIDNRLRIDLLMCGHTHGGQVRVPLLGTPIVPSMYGQKYAQGFVRGPACEVFISRGVGTTILPLRFRVRPEIAVIEFRSA